jgi:SAM-dependent methyltransferase
MTTITEPLATTVDHFESIYADAAGDPRRIPWGGGQPSSALVNWLNAVAPTLVRCGARVAVMGCGLGGDAREVIRRGYEVTAFDCSETAVGWARALDPAHAERYVRADLFEPPARWTHRFDLVIESNNLQSLAPSMHEPAMQALARLVSPHGRLLVVCRGRAAEQPAAPETAGPPWPLTSQELLAAAAAASLTPEGALCSFRDDQDVPRIRALFRRA